MNAQQRELAQRCMGAAEANTMTFPDIITALMGGGFEIYTVDFRQAASTFYLTSGESIAVPIHQNETPISEVLDVGALQGAIREAQNLVTGYTYRGFCIKAKSAGCAGYMVSFSGRRALYFGRTAEVHTEHFPSRS